MTTTITRPAITPTPAEIAEFREQIANQHLRYAYTAGYLISLVNGIAAEHRCRKAGCMTCHRLRRGLALIAAIDAIEAEPTSGGA
jgi:hypothetical protein